MSKSRNTKPYPIYTLINLLNNKNLDLNPKYQRESVWTLYQKQLLIDTIIEDLDIPKVYFRDITDPTNPRFKKFEVVDGQQRIRAIQSFINNEFPLYPETNKFNDDEIANLKFNELPTDLQNQLHSYSLDVVILENYNDEDVEEMFLRLQNGTPLNAAEKRRAINSGLKELVTELSKNKVFNDHCAFSNKRYAFEDVSAKILHFHLNQKISEIKPNYIRQTYDFYKNIDISNKHFLDSKKSLNFLKTSFDLINDKPNFKKGELLTISFLVTELLSQYNISNFKKEFADSFIQLETERAQDSEKDIELQNPELVSLRDSLRSDSIQNLKYRHDFYKEHFLKKLINLEPLDDIRIFSEDQKSALYSMYKGKCNICRVDCDRNNFHADHIKPFSMGGKTALSNGQLLCVNCNLSKGSKY